MDDKKREFERNKQLLQYYRMMVAVILILFISLLCVSILTLNDNPTLLTVVILCSVVFIMSFAIYACKIEADIGYYRCSKCGHIHKSSWKQVTLAMHFGMTRKLKCPKCNEKSWSKKVLIDE
jgi:hypothetical protein